MQDMLIDKDGNVLATVDYEQQGRGYTGFLSDMNFPESVRSVFLIHEEYVNENMMAVVPRIEKEIEALGLSLQQCGQLLENFQLMNGCEVFFQFKKPG